MSGHPELANPFFALLALMCAALVGGLAVLTAAAAVSAPGRRARDAVLAELAPRAVPLAAVIATVATLGSLYYSEVVGFTPCVLCWYQRICMYPLAAILWIGAVRRDGGVAQYAAPFCVAGPAVSGYHALVERWPSLGGGLSCSAEAPCTVPWFTEFGFVTLAWMALFGFLAIGTLLLVAARGRWRPSLEHPDGWTAVAPPPVAERRTQEVGSA
jgi:disulfide bond formation protein DsbB